MIAMQLHGCQSKSESDKAQSRGMWGACPQEMFETALSEMLFEGSFGVGALCERCQLIS